MSTDLFTTLRAADPARGRGGYSDDELTRLAGEIARRADAGGAGSGARQVARRPDVRRLWPVLPAAAAVTLALVLGPALAGSPSASAEAVAVLNEAADNITAVDPPARPDQWWQVTTTGYAAVYLKGVPPRPDDWVVVLEQQTRTQYLAVDGARPTVTVDGPRPILRQLAGPPAGSDDLRAALGEEAGAAWTSTIAPNEAGGTWSSPTPEVLANLPRDPAALRERLYADAAGQGTSADVGAFVSVVDLLRTGIVPADLRAALYRVLATIPGVEVTSRAASVGTASGVAFGQDDAPNGTRQEIVVDPATGALVGERRVVVTDGVLPAGTVVEETAVTRSVVDAVPADVRSAAVVKDCWVDADRAVACRNP